MSPSLLFLLPLLLLSPLTHTWDRTWEWVENTTIPPNIAAQGRIPGPTFRHLPPNTDWLTNTRCHCYHPSSPSNTNTSEVAQIYQWNYYNVHLNATFVMTMNSLNLNFAFPFTAEAWCQLFPIPLADLSYRHPFQKHRPTGRNATADEVCIYPKYRSLREGLLPWWESEEEFGFNGQKRGLKVWGNQGWKEIDGGFVEEQICPTMCEEWIAPAGQAEGLAGWGKRTVWSDVDDMCDNCF